MDLLQEVIQKNKEEKFWEKTDRLLLAVSGGLDSMVLLDVIQSLPESIRPTFAVIHVNHQLRKESEKEEEYLRSYCKKLGIDFHVKKWDAGLTITADIENQARIFRYEYFYETIDHYNYTGLITAHHGDDQAETILMRLIKGSTLEGMTGIKPIRNIQERRIIRPFLSFSKEQLRVYSEQFGVVYFEDETNRSDEYLRNRLRLQIIPEMKKENPNFLNHIHTFIKQLTYANDIVTDKTTILFQENVIKKSENYWEMNRKNIALLKEREQYFVLVHLWQLALVEQQVEVKENQIQQALHIINSKHPQQKVHLPKGWVFETVYEKARLYKVLEERINQEEFHLELGKSFTLSCTEWIGLFRVEEHINIPQSMEKFKKYELIISDQILLPLKIRRRRDGDKLVFNRNGQHKKINRIFIDHKITNEVREKSWVITDSKEDILWLAPVKESYLSIPQETDKIHYRLIYLRNERDLEGELYVKKGH